MNEKLIKIRAKQLSAELEIEGPTDLVKEWWDRVWPALSASSPSPSSNGESLPHRPQHGTAVDYPDNFGEHFTSFRSDITDVDRMLIAGAYVQIRDAEKSFTTKEGNQLLLDQNVKVSNPSESVRRLIQTKKAFVAGDGRYRVSTVGFDHLKLLISNA